MQDFKQRVIKFIQKVPRGKVVSYGQVAAFAGSPRSARQVGGVLKSVDVTTNAIPWWRVINSQGFLSIKGNWTATKELQRNLLKKEGIKVDKDYKLDINKYRWLGKHVS